MSVLPRTAVIVVHGIGEQRPLDTIRRFVGRGDGKGGLLERTDANHVFVNPDRVSGRTYARRLSFDHTHRVDEGGVPHEVVACPEGRRKTYSRTTHFYEYYWAYRFRDTAWWHLPPLLSRIVRTKRSQLAPGTMSGGVGFWSKATRLIIFMLAASFAVTVAVSVGYAASGEEPPGWHVSLPNVVSDLSFIWVAMALAVALLIAVLSLAVTMGVLTTVRTMLELPVVATAGAGAEYLVAASAGPAYTVLSATAVILLTLPVLIDRRPRVKLAVPEFGPPNAIFAPESFLFDVGIGPGALFPIDPVAASRVPLCGGTLTCEIASSATQTRPVPMPTSTPSTRCC